MLKLGAIAAALLVSLVLVAEADARGGSGTVTTFGVGPLPFDVSGLGDVAAFAGEPDKIVDQDNQGNSTRLVYGDAQYAIAEFKYPSHGETDYSYYWDGSEWLFEQFDTTLERFHTVRGTRVAWG